MKRILLTTAAIALSVATLAEAQPRERGEGGQRGGWRGQQQQQAQPQRQAQAQAQPRAERHGGQRGEWRGQQRSFGQNPGAQAPGVQAPGAQAPGFQRQGPQGPQGVQAGRPDRRPDAVAPQRGPDRRMDRQPDRRDDQRWDRGDNRRFDNDRGRRDYRQYRNGRSEIWRAPRRFQAPIYRYPRGYTTFSWSFGSILPPVFYADQYVLHDFWNYGLPEPYPGAFWVRAGSDALMIERGSGYVIEVVRDLFW